MILVSDAKPIQWFPGHMAKAKREIKEHIKQVDLVIELKDARIPYSSTNPMVDEIVGNKPRLILLNKSTLADPKVTKAWMDYYKKNGILSLDIDSISLYNIKNIKKYCQMALHDVFLNREKKGIKSKQIKALIIGIPNVGKSTLINTLAKRKAVKVGDKPGVTKSQTWIKVDEDLFLLDTPGILWPKFEDQMVGLKLAMAGSIKDEILDMEYIVANSISYLSKEYPEYIKSRFNLEQLDEDPYQVMEQIGKKRGCIVKGGAIDYDRVRVIFMNELRGNKIGAMSYEKPEE